MIQKIVKLRLNKTQTEILENWLTYSMRIYNWGIRKIETHAQMKEYFSKMEFQNILAGHSKRLEMPSCIIQGLLIDAHSAWSRCFKKIGGKPKFKGARRPLKSMPHVSPVSPKNVLSDRIKLSVIGWLRFHKQELPEGKVKQVRIIKKASGWHLGLFIDAEPVKVECLGTEKVGIHPGISQHLTLSDGIIIQKRKRGKDLEKRLAQAQRGGNKKLVARLHEKIANRRKHDNHVLSRHIVKGYNHIIFGVMDYKKIAKKFGKGVAESAIYQLRQMIKYKAENAGITYEEVESLYHTATCNVCKQQTGPTGMKELKIKAWRCSNCNTLHDREKNAAINVLNKLSFKEEKKEKKPKKTTS